MPAVLDVQDITVRFGGIVAVEGVSLQINDGNLVGFIGPNGAGKTTFMRAITGIVKPQSGRVLLDGHDISKWAIDARIRGGLALAQQIVQPHRNMSITDNVALACGNDRTRNVLMSLITTDRTAQRARAQELLHMVGLGDVADSQPSTLPLGYLKRLEVARAMALNPKLLLLDEPLAGLNQSEANSMANLIRTLHESGQTILLIEHNLREVIRICPALYVQDNGKPLAFGATAEVMANPAVRKAYLGVAHDA